MDNNPGSTTPPDPNSSIPTPDVAPVDNGLEPVTQTNDVTSAEFAQPVSSALEPTPTADPVDGAAPTADASATADTQAVPVTPAEAPSVTPPLTQNPGFALGLTSLILALVGLGLFSLIFGIMGLKKSKKAGLGNGLAIGGIVIGAIEVVLGLVVIIFVAIALPTILNYS